MGDTIDGIYDPDAKKPFEMTVVRIEAAGLIAGGRHSVQEVADLCEVSVGTIYYWQQQAVFRKEIAAQRTARGEEMSRLAIARQFDRIESKNWRWLKLKDVILAREAEFAEVVRTGIDPMEPDADVVIEPGVATGLLARKVTKVGTGERQHTVVEYTADTGLLRSMSELETETMKELGQGGVEKLDMTSGGSPFGALFAGVSDADLDARIAAAEARKASEVIPE